MSVGFFLCIVAAIFFLAYAAASSVISPVLAMGLGLFFLALGIATMGIKISGSS
jgi:hypothetical protein